MLDIDKIQNNRQYREPLSDQMTYLISEKPYDGFIKIGLSDSPKRRRNDLQTGNPRELEVLSFCNISESAVQQAYKDYQVNREWFKMSENLKDTLKEDFDFLREIQEAFEDYNELERYVSIRMRRIIPEDISTLFSSLANIILNELLRIEEKQKNWILNSTKEDRTSGIKECKEDIKNWHTNKRVIDKLIKRITTVKPAMIYFNVYKNI